MFKVIVLPVLAAVFMGSMGAAASEIGDAERGLKVYKKCASCHMVGPEAKNRVGPPLNDIVSAKAGAVTGYKYSKAMKNAAKGGLTWAPEALDAFLLAPRKFLPKTKMSFRGLKKAQDRLDVIAYLASFSSGNIGAEMEDDFTVSLEILGLKGDKEYGEYLSGECTTCHQDSGNNDGIPAIVGWDTAAFVTAMHAYRQKHRENPVMQLVTGRLSDEEIAALAAYFKDLAGRSN